MKAATTSLRADAAFDFIGSDGHFEVSAPAGAINSGDIIAAGGSIHLRVEQLQGASGSTNSGRIVLGTYQITVLGARGPLPLFAFHQPLTFSYHYAASDLGVIQPDHAFVILDDGSSLPPGTTTSKAQTSWSSTESRSLATRPASNDSRSQTLSYTTPSTATVSGAGTTTATFGTSAPMASWGTVQEFQTDLNAGALSYSYPLDVPTGPDGIKPDLQLAYSSGTVNETEGVQAAASWVGEGWSLSLGSISWAQYQGDATSGTQENEWQITTPDGISAQLFPPNMSVTTTGTLSSITSAQWYTAPESHDKIVETTANTNGGTYACFRVWLPDGTMEEYGCTNDSRQYYTQSGTQYTYRWDLDMIADPHGNQILVTYAPTSSNGNIVDAVPAHVYYDIPSCQYTSTRCSTNSALVDVRFDSVIGKPSRLNGTTTTTCQNWSSTTSRCDDPANLSSSGGLAAPTVISENVLNDVQVYVRPNTGASYGMLRAYYFWYEQGQGTTITDPATGLQEGTAGYLDLTQIQEFGTDSTTGPNGTSYPPLTFSYTGSYQERYEDLSEPSANSSCAPWYSYNQGSGTIGLEVVQQEGTQLREYWRDDNFTWHAGVTFGSNIASAPSVTFMNRSNFDGYSSYSSYELVVRLQNGQLQHWTRTSQGTWTQDESFPAVGTGAPAVAYNPKWGTLDVVVRDGSQLAHYSLKPPAYVPSAWSWGGGETFGDNITGDPAIAVDTSGTNEGNIEVAVVHSGQLTHYWGVPGSTTTTWNGPEVFGDAGKAYLGVAISYNPYSTLPGFLEFAAVEDGSLVYYYETLTSSGPVFTQEFQPYDSSITSGPASTMYTSGNFEVVAQKNGQLVKYWVTPGGWRQDATFGDGNLSASSPALAANTNTRCYYAYSMATGQPTAYPALWSQTVSQRYLAAFDDGRGMQETFTWAEAHMNVWGGYDGAALGDPLSCTGLETTEPCFRADDRNWSRVILVRRDETVERSESVNGTPATTDVDTVSRYTYTLTPVQSTSYFLPFDSANNIQGGLYDWNWGSVNSADYLNYYNPEYRGFDEATVDVWESDNGNTGTWLSSTDLFYSTTSGWGVWDAGYVTTCANSWSGKGYCPTSPYWSATSALPNQSPVVYPGNALPGREVQTDTYNITGGSTRTLLQRVITSYAIDTSGGNTSLDTCGPAGDPYSTPAPYPNYWKDIAKNNQLMLVSQLSNLSNPVAVCDPREASQDTFYVEGSTASIPTTCTATTASIPCQRVDYSYDTNQSYGAHDYGNLTVEQTSGNDLGGAVTVKMMDYAAEDSIQTSGSPPTGVYIVDAMQQQAVRDTSTTGTVHAFTQQFYDGSFTLGVLGNWGELTRIQDAYQTDSGSSTGYDSIVYRYTYDDSATGNALAERYPDLQGGGCTIGSVGYSTCATYDTSAYDAQPTSVTNALGYMTSTAYTNASGGYDATDGFGQWLTGTTDPNGATTSYAYDALGRLTAITKPVHSNATTQQFAYVDSCPATSPNPPCIELDTTQSISSGVSVTTRSFEDGAGRSVETLAPAPSGSGTLVSYTLYDALGRKVFVSEPYTVATTTSFSAYDLTKPGTQYAYDALDRVTSTQLVPSYNATPTNTTTTSYALACGVVMGDSNCYQQATTIDPNGHRADTYTDALGRTVYARSYSGNSGASYAAYATTAYQYDVLNHVTQITYPDGTHTATFTYDLLGRVTKQTDPDRGGSTPWSYAYDNDGNLVQQTDPRGSNVYVGYDALDRPTWRNTTNSASGAYVTFSYDSRAPFCTGTTCPNNDFGIGHLTGETFSASGLSGSETFYYDANGRAFAEEEMTSPTYTMQQTYNDADQPVTTTYPDGEQVTVDYNAAGAPQDMQTTPSGGTATFVISSVGYASDGQIASLGFGGSPSAPVFTEAFSYDAHQHLTAEAATLAGASTAFYNLALSYDPAYNLLSATTTLPAVGTHPAGTEQQSFCYDEQNRLVWAGTTGIPSNPPAGTCGPAPTPTTLDGGNYSASYAYDTLNRLTSGPAGSTYTYGDPNHLDAVTSTSGGYSASYDASGNMTCRAPSSSTTCTGGTPTGAKLTFDNEGRLAGWQSTYTSVNGTQTASYLYDGGGNRVEQSTATRGLNGSTATLYLGNGLADYSFSSAPTPTHVNHYPFAGRVVAVRDSATGGTLHYLLADQLSSPELQLSASGAAEAVALRSPYGASRYGASDLYTYGFTGQRSDDTTSGLDYYGARYYDATVGQFISADSDPKGGLNRYAYVGGNPETRTDPSGHRVCNSDGSDCSGPIGGGSKVGVISSKWLDDWFLISTTEGGSSDNYATRYEWGRWLLEFFSNGTSQQIEIFANTTGCDKVCSQTRDEAAVKEQAQQDADFFTKMAIALSVLAGALGAAAILCAAVFGCGGATAWLGWLSGAFFATVVPYVVELASAFSGAASHDDLSWYTEQNISESLDIAVGSGVLFGGISAGSFLATAVKGTADALEAVEITAGLIGTLGVFGLTMLTDATLDAIAWNDEMTLEDIATADQSDWFGAQPPQS